MSFQLVYGDYDLALPLVFEIHVEHKLTQLISGMEPRSAAQSELAKRIVDVLTALIESNVVPPTEKQIKYAIAIARELSIQLSPDVLQFREAMAAFLSANVEAFRRRKAAASVEARK